MVAYKCGSSEKGPEVAVKSELEVVVKEELNSYLDIDNDFLQNFDDP